jgi:uncharacterized membrane protein (DUF373 family)
MIKDILPSVAKTGPNQNNRQDAPGPIPHTQVHTLLRRTFENLQDVIAALLMVLLLVLSLQALWRLAHMALVEGAPPTQVLSEVLFLLILMELYRLLIFYLREHRISVALAVEVALVTTLREVMVKEAHDLEWLRLLGVSLLLIVLGGLLAMERWMGRCRNEVSETNTFSPRGRPSRSPCLSPIPSQVGGTTTVPNEKEFEHLCRCRRQGEPESERTKGYR